MYVEDCGGDERGFDSYLLRQTGTQNPLVVTLPLDKVIVAVVTHGTKACEEDAG
jgi:hypothetical protein